MTSTYGWLITHDSIADDEDKRDNPAPSNLNAPGVIGPRDIGPDHIVTLEAVARAGFKNYKGESVQKFKMYDDDGILYYTGLFIGDEAEMFGPLDDFGGPNAGATEIRYLNRETGEYETL